MQVCKLCGTPNASISNRPSPLRLTRLRLTTEPTERGKNLKRMLFHSRAAASRERVLFYFGPSSFFRCWSVRPPLTFSTTRKKKIVEGEKNRETWPSGKERFFSFLVETRHTYITRHITTEYKHHGASSERKHDQPERPDRGIRGQRPHRGKSRRTRFTVEERPVVVAV